MKTIVKWTEGHKDRAGDIALWVIVLTAVCNIVL